MRMLKIIFLFLTLLTTAEGFAQKENQPFYKEIQEFKKQDSINPPPKGSIVFVGSSSFQKWKNVQEMFPGYTIINRGFGGSSLPDVIRYAEDIIYPYQPKQVVIYCGDNDIASSDTVDSRVVAERFKTLFGMIRKNLPNASIVFVSIKPSPSREKFMPIMKQANQIIRNFLWQYGNTGYVDVFTPMLNAEGRPKDELFLEDKLHMKAEGYEIWQKAIRPFLLRN
jgi:lysophospholipase L1-like esterase